MRKKNHRIKVAGWRKNDVFMFLKDIRNDTYEISNGGPKIKFKAFTVCKITNINKHHVFFTVLGKPAIHYVRLIPKRMAPATETARMLYEYKDN